MSEGVVLPLWLVVIMSVAALASIYRHIFLPLVALYLTAQERKLNEKLRGDLSRQIPEVLRIGRKARVELFANSPEVKIAIEQAVAQGQGTRELLEYRVLEYARELTPGFYSLFYFKIGYLLARFYIRLLYVLKIAKPPPPEVAEIPEGASIVLVGNHRSNLDVMMLAYLSSRTNMVSFAAGEWGKAWPMSTLLHLSGSYIIRRAEPLPLYRKILAIHLRNLVAVKMPQGIFLEGGLTRDGSIQEVKLGLLSYILSALEAPNVQDIVFLPVAFNYDQVPEDQTLLSNQEHGFADRSKLFTVFSTLGSLGAVIYRRLITGRALYGNAAVSFGAPVSVNNWLAEQGIAQPLPIEQRRAIVAPVADTLIRRIERILPILPISIIATVFVDAGEESLHENQVLEKSTELVNKLLADESILVFPPGEIHAQVNSGLEIMLSRKVLLKDGSNYRRNPGGDRLLHYIYNSTRHLIAREEPG